MSLCVLAGGLLLSSTAAQAAATHNYLYKISEVPAGPEVAFPGALAGNGGNMTADSGDLWLLESKFVEPENELHGVLSEFNAANGQFVSQRVLPERGAVGGIAFGHATGETESYVSQYRQAEGLFGVAVFDGSGTQQGFWTGADTPAGSFGSKWYVGVAVDNSTSLSDWAKGDVYVSDPAHKVVDVFQPEAGGKEKYLTQLTGTSPSEPFAFPIFEAGYETVSQRVAVDDATGDLIVIDGNTLDLFEPTVFGEYAFVRTLTPPSPTIAFKPRQVDAGDGEGDIYVIGGVEENGQEMGRQVLEFSASGAFLGRVSAATAPGGTWGIYHREEAERVSVASDPLTHDVYVETHNEGSSRSPVFAFGGNVVIPDVLTAPVSGVKATGAGSFEATVNGSVNPDGAGQATCRFDWGAGGSLGEAAPCSAPVPAGESPVPVSATIGGLQPDTAYSFRLQATDANGTNPGEPWQDLSFRTPGPGLHGEAVSAVRAESATFEAKLDPHGAPSTYYFQYGTSTAYGADEPVLNGGIGATAGAGEGDLEVSQHTGGLRPGAVYHYRLVVVSEWAPGQIETFFGPDQTFTTQPQGVPFRLPDGRAWEMVSPPQKEGALLMPDLYGPTEASVSGNAFAGMADFQPTEAQPAGSDNLDQVFYGRGAGGWVSKTIIPPHAVATGVSVGQGWEYRAFSANLARAIMQPFGGFTALSPEATETTPYLHTDYLNGDPGQLCGTGCYLPLVTAGNVPPGTMFGEEEKTTGECEKKGAAGVRLDCGPQFIAGTPDLSHVLLVAKAALTATPLEGATPETTEGLYEWGAGRLALVNVLPADESNTKGGPLAFATSFTEDEHRHALSDDGSRVIWMGQAGNTVHLYLRDMGAGETVRLDLPQAGATGTGETFPEYMTASADASRVFFLDQELTADSTPSSGNHELDLYEYNLDAPLGSRLTDLSVDHNESESATVSMVIGASEDGSYVYFAARGALAPGATGNCPANEGIIKTPCNLYVSHAGQLEFIASLSNEDRAAGAQDLKGLGARVSPNGRWLAFMSNLDLTGYETTDAVSRRPDEEVYLYDALQNRLVCASCNPTGARPVGVVSRTAEGERPVLGELNLETTTWVASNVPGWEPGVGSQPTYQPRYLADSGRLFFDSNDALVPQDVNGTEDAYEYEPVGVGDCATANVTYSTRSGGCVDLISSGTSNEESAFLDASEAGGDVFFLTNAGLAPLDFDKAPDVYDAHECTAGSPCIAQAPAPPPPCDNADSCKPAQSLQPTVFGAGPSETFSGAGNVTPSAPGVQPRGLTRAQKLARALRVCARVKGRRGRAVCVRRARRQYGGGAARNARRSRGNQSAGTRR